MNAVMSFQRLLWKEFRVLRNVWLGCAIGVLFLMLVILAIGESTTNSQGYSTAFWIFMVWIPPVYVLAALATMFAGEREEGTLVWLTALSPRLATVFSSRLLFVIVTGIALQVWYGLSAWTLSQFDQGYNLVGAEDFQESLVLMTFLLAESLAFGMFWSLQTNRPLNAILYAALTIIGVNTAAVVATEVLGGRMMIRSQGALGYAFGFWGWLRCLIVLAAMVANWQLAGQWLVGRPYNWEWAAQWLSKRRLATVAPGQVAVMPMEASEPWSRAWQRLRWLEWQGLTSYFWVVLAMTLVACGMLLTRAGRSGIAFSIAAGWLAVFIAGLASWHGEQTHQRFRALVRLGVSPYALWANKFATWFIASAAAVGFIFAITTLWWNWLASFYGPSHYPPWYVMQQSNGSSSTAEVVVYGVCYFVALFALAFNCAHLIRKTVIAFGVSAIGIGLFTAWMLVCEYYGLPWFVFFAPIPLWLLWISASALPNWWTENTSWRLSRSRMKTLALQGLFPFAVLMLAAGYRVWEVPRVVVLSPTIHQPSLITNSPTTVQSWTELETLLSKPLKLPAEIDVNDIQAGIYSPAMLAKYQVSLEGMLAKIVDANRADLDELAARILRLTTVSASRSRSNNGSKFEFLAFLIYAARERLDAGDVDHSLEFLQAGARLAGMLQRNQPINPESMIRDASMQTGHIRAEMVRWAQHPKQTEATLRRGLQLCAGELRYWQTQPHELYLLRNQERQTIDNRYSLYFWELWRKQRLIDVAYENRLTYLSSSNATWIPPGLAQRNTPEFAHTVMQVYGSGGQAYSHLPAWRFIPHEERQYWTMQWLHKSDVYGLDVQTIEAMHDRENEYRATLVTMALVGDRRIHGSLPVSLSQAERYCLQEDVTVPEGHQRRWFLPKAFKDVWSGEPFLYAPTGFTVDGPEFPPESKYRQPLLYTGGAQHMLVTVAGSEIHRHTQFGGRPVLETIESEKLHRSDWIFPIPPQIPESSAEAK